MEISQPLAIESFSYRWLSDTNPNSSSSSSSSASDHQNNLNELKNNYNFDFDIPLSASSPINLAHADEIFSDGHIKPVFLHRLSSSSSSSKEIPRLRRASISLPSSPIPSYVSENKYDYQMGNWKRSSLYKRLLQKCTKFVKPLCKSLGCSRKSNRVSDVEGRVCESQSWNNNNNNSVHASPRLSSGYSADDTKKIYFIYGLKKMKSWSSSSPQASPRVSPSHYSCKNNVWSDVDQSSIHEAILYCKRSIEK